MAEVIFTRQFLTFLDQRPAKISSDYVADPRKLPPQAAYILPRMPNSYVKASVATDATAESATGQVLTVTLKPLRSTPQTPASVTVKITSPHQSSIFDLKSQAAKQTGYALDKVKILWERKPVADTKTLAEVVGEGSLNEEAIEMGIIYMGAPTAPSMMADNAAHPMKDLRYAGGVEGQPPQDVEMADSRPIAQGISGNEVLETKEFWEDLKSFLMQRIRDEQVSEGLARLFRESWRTKIQGR